MQLKLLLALLTLVVALALPLKAKAMTAEGWVGHWQSQRHIHVSKKRWVRTHPQYYTFKLWNKLLRKHTNAIIFATAQIERWKYKTKPPHHRDWLCIHHFEGSWSDSGDPYWGGLQMDRSFMKTYAPAFLLRKGWANKWTPLEQEWVAERAHASGRGFGPWPNTAHYCGLI
jgi:hypothetical protein